MVTVLTVEVSNLRKNIDPDSIKLVPRGLSGNVITTSPSIAMTSYSCLPQVVRVVFAIIASS